MEIMTNGGNSMHRDINYKSHLLQFVTFLFFSLGLIYTFLQQNSIANAAASTWYVAIGGSDANPCNSPDQPCATLQAAVDKAAAGDTVLAASDTFPDGFSLTKDLIMSGGWDPTFTSRDGMTTIDMGNAWAKTGIGVDEGVTAQIEYYKVQNGDNYAGVGGLSNRGNLMLSHCVLTHNKGFYGGGVFNSGTMTISESSIDHNYDTYLGGGVYNQGEMTILHSSIDHNIASDGGGVYNHNPYIINTLVIKDSALWANESGTGGGIKNLSYAELINTTIAENIGNYAGIYHSGTSIYLSNCSVIANQGIGLVADGGDNVHLNNTIMIKNTSGDALNEPFLDGYNLIGSIINPTGGFVGPGNLIGIHQGVVYPLEGWPIYAPLTPTSMAIDHGDPSGCRDSNGNILDTDMRGMPRFRRCDIGAYELQPIGFSTFTADHGHPHTDSTVTYEIDLINKGTDVITGGRVTNELPVSFTYIPDSLKASSGNVGFDQGIITWDGSIEAGQSISIQYQVNVGTITGTITNTATIIANEEVLNRSVLVRVVDQYYIFAPCVSRACKPAYFDNFSDPNSGWPIEDNSNYRMDYISGEYQILVKNPGRIAGALIDLGSSDFQLEVDARPETNLEGGEGLFFSISEHGFYFFEISDKWFILWRNDSDPWIWTPLIDWTYSSAINPRYESNRLKVLRIGDSISIYANNNLLGTVNDGTYHGTGLGMMTESWSGGYDGRYDNFIVNTGVCIETKSVSIPLNRAISFDTLWGDLGIGPDWYPPGLGSSK
jgi:uncharacterized repeat protein (TIGR01451 family)